MSIPVWVLLGFAGWTLLALLASVGVYRWSRILTARASLAEWRADKVQGSDFYQRAMRAHANCVENLPVYAAIVVAALAADARGHALDVLAVILLVARIAQTTVHLSLLQSERVVAFRFTFYFTQLACMWAMGTLVALQAMER